MQKAYYEPLFLLFGVNIIVNYCVYFNATLYLLVNSFILALIFAIKWRKLSSNNAIILFIIGVISIIVTNLMHSATGIGIIIINLILMQIVFREISINIRAYKLLHILVFSGLAFYLAQIDFDSFSYRLITIDSFGNETNGNNIGFLIAFSFFHFRLCLYNLVKKKVCMAFSFLCFLIAEYYILLTGCRTAALMLGVYYLLLCLKKTSFNNEKFIKIIMLEIIVSMIFPLVYIGAYYFFDNIEVMGKTIFSGREYVWLKAYELIMEFPMFGSGNDYTYGDLFLGGGYSSHNFLLGVMKMFGIIPTISIIILFKKYLDKGISDRNMQFVILSMLIATFFEASLAEAFSSPIMMLLLVKYKEKR